MSEGRQLLEAARRAQSIERADDLARQAVLAEPDLADAYLVRGQLAVHAGEAAQAAFHLRIAFARGARDGFTRDVLAHLLDQVGQSALANRMRAGVTAPAALHNISHLGPGAVAAVRDALSRPLPPPGQPGLLSGEARPQPPLGPPARTPTPTPAPARMPTPAPVRMSTPIPSRAPTPAPGSSRPRTEPYPGLPTGSLPPVSLPPAESPRPRQSSLAPRPATMGPFGAPIRPTSAPLAPIDTPHRGPVIKRVGGVAPDWLESTPEFESTSSAGDAGWLDDAIPAPLVPNEGVHFEAGGIELALDPGVVEGGFVSPVTRTRVSAAAQEQERRDGHMPALTGTGDEMEGYPAFAATHPVETLDLAVLLPGPVLTRPGRSPQTLTRKIALALQGKVLLMADLSTPSAPVQRLPLDGFERIDVLKEGRQVSFVYGDGRALHLDLRALRDRALLVAVRFVDLIEARVSALG